MRALVACLLLASASAYAGTPVTFAEVCVGFTLKQTPAGVEVRCPGTSTPWLLVDRCLGAVATRDRTTGKVTIKCGAGSTAKVSVMSGEPTL